MLISSLLLAAPLWQIGAPDGKPTDFGLAPRGYARYGSDPLYVVGSSTVSEWTYVLPGPDDLWASNRRHLAEVVFGLSEVQADAPFRLTVDFADTHPISPPRLEMVVNGKPVAAWQAPAGASDAVILGERETGKASHWTVEIPAGSLRNGDNTIGIRSVGGSWGVFDALRLEGPDDAKVVPVRGRLRIDPGAATQAILRTPQGPRQPVSVEITNLGPATAATVWADGMGTKVNLRPGRQTIELRLPPVQKRTVAQLKVTAGRLSANSVLPLDPVRPWTILLFPHSHVDIGYTGFQASVLQMHERNLIDTVAVADENRANPPASRFRFNVEATWVLDRFLSSAPPAKKAAVVEAIKNGTLAVSGGYANLLTGVMHPEELMQSLRYSRILGQKLGIDFDTVSQTDVPGVTWGNVVALHEAGIKNLVLMPNAGDRVGRVHRAWQDKPFWWVGPSGKERVLVWQTDPYSVGVRAGWNGDRSRTIRTDDPSGRFIGDFLFPKLNRLIAQDYPYDIVGEPWSVNDNAPVDADVPRAAKVWNERYVYPRVVLSTLSDACRELTRRYGNRLPVVRGDYTPYWEDGVGSTAAETAINRTTPDRLIQAETLFAMRNPAAYPAEEFLEAWRNVLLFSEHTWGAAQSVSSPNDPETLSEWRVKSGFARKADEISRRLLAQALGTGADVEVRNTLSWPRTDLVRLPKAQSKAGDRVVDSAGRPLPSQRLRSGELAVLARNVPAFGAIRLRVVAGPAYADPKIQAKPNASGNGLTSDRYQLTLDPQTGAIASLKGLRQKAELAQKPLNAYLYLPGSNPQGIQANTNVRFETVEPGPLVATIRAVSEAPGTKGLVQEVTVTAGLDRVELTNTVDKLDVREKEGVHFAFPFAVPNGQVRLDLPWALVRPEKDQIAGANKNWLTTQGYADVSNSRFGVTWTSLDAPLLEVGELSANLLGSVSNPDEWRATIGPTQILYSWPMNNHWHTNYKASQSGRLTFRYALHAHGAFAPDVAARMATGLRQPLLVGPASSPVASLLTLQDPTVVTTRVVPSDDGKALIVRLYGASSEDKRVRLRWRPGLGRVTRTDLGQRPGALLGETVTVPGRGVLTLRVELTRSVRRG